MWAKFSDPDVLALVAEAQAAGTPVFVVSRHIVKVEDGVPSYLGGGEGDRAWKVMSEMELVA